MSVASPELASRGPAVGPPPGDLVLRLRGPVRNGQVVRLASPKCVVGSAPNCTLRLRLPGVREVHCVILRGATTIVRRWSPDTRLNGAAFQDAPLKVGDRLAVGPLELEVLADGGPWPLPEAKPQEPAAEAKPKTTNIARRLEAAVAGSSQRTRRLLEKLDSAQRSVADLEHRAAARQQQLAAFADRLVQLEARTRAAEGKESLALCAAPNEAKQDERLVSLISAVSELQGELSRERDARAGQTHRLHEELASVRFAWEQASERLANLAVLPVAPSPAVAVQESSATLTAERQLAANRELDERCAELAAQHAAAEERARELAARARELDARAEQLREAEREVGRSRGELAVEQLRFDQERETAGRDLADRRQDLERHEVRLENKREEMTVRQKLWEELHAEQARAAAQAAEAAETTVEPTATEANPVGEVPAHTEACETAVAAPVHHRSPQPEPTGELAAALREYESNLTFHAGLESHGAMTPAIEAPADPEQPAAESTERDEAPPAEHPADVDEQIRRIRELMAEADRSEPTPREPFLAEEPSPLPAAMEPAVDEPEPVQPEPVAPPEARVPAPTPRGHDDEESIEAYMARLMQRVQGGAAEPPAKPAGPSLRAAMGIEAKAKTETPAEPESAPQPEITRVMDASEFVPRAKAPEKSSGLEAMRELANHSARSAIENSNKRKGGQEWVFRAFYAAVSGLAGLGVASWFGWFSLIGGVAAGVGLLLAGLWAFQAMFLYQQALAQAAENALNIPPDRREDEEESEQAGSEDLAAEA